MLDNAQPRVDGLGPKPAAAATNWYHAETWLASHCCRKECWATQ